MIVNEKAGRGGDEWTATIVFTIDDNTHLCPRRIETDEKKPHDVTSTAKLLSQSSKDDDECYSR